MTLTDMQVATCDFECDQVCRSEGKYNLNLAFGSSSVCL